MSWISRKSQNGNSNKEKGNSFFRWASWLFLVSFILIFIFIFYRSEITSQSDNQSHYFKYYLFVLTGILFWGVVLRLREKIQANIVMVSISLIVGLYLVEGGLYFLDSRQITKLDIIAEMGIENDIRTKFS